MIKQRGWAGVSRAFTELPQSTEQIIHFDKYAAREQPIKVGLPDVSSLLGSGWKRIDADINGEFGYFLILSEFNSKKDARAAAAGWGGDQSTLYENAAKGQLMLAHLSVWDTGRDAEEFFRAYTERTLKRYPPASPRATRTENEHAFQTADGETFIQLRDNSVLVVEGLPTELREKMARLALALWK